MSQTVKAAYGRMIRVGSSRVYTYAYTCTCVPCVAVRRVGAVHVGTVGK